MIKATRHLLLQIAAVTAGALAQSSEHPPRPNFKTGMTNVLLDVVVTGHHGAPVEDLSQSNFSILENGQPRSVVGFEAHSPASAPT